METVWVSLMHTDSKMPTRWQTHISNVDDDWVVPSGHLNNSSQVPIGQDIIYSLRSMQVDFVMIILQIICRDTG